MGGGEGPTVLSVSDRRLTLILINSKSKSSSHEHRSNIRNPIVSRSHSKIESSFNTNVSSALHFAICNGIDVFFLAFNLRPRSIKLNPQSFVQTHIFLAIPITSAHTFLLHGQDLWLNFCSTQNSDKINVGSKQSESQQNGFLRQNSLNHDDTSNVEQNCSSHGTISLH